MFQVRCSSLARTMQCAGFNQIEDKLYSPTNEAAKTGTAAGEYLEAILTQRTLEPKLGMQASNGVYFDDEMKYYLEPFASNLLEKVPDQILCEQRIDWMSEAGVRVKGSFDMGYVIGDTLHIDDLKYGYGIIEPFENWQLLGYGIGEVLRRGRWFEKIVLRIFQPRPRHESGPIREWVLSYDELLTYKTKIEAQLSKVSMGMKELVTGPSCKWCPAAHNCSALSQAAYNAVDVILNDFSQDTLKNEDISRELGLLDRVNDILKIKKDSLEQLGISRIRNGGLVPGFVIEESFGNRYWKKNVTAESLKLMTGVNVSKNAILSPAKCEKLGVPKEITNALTERWSKGQKLVQKNTTDIGNKIFNKEKNQ